VKEAGNEALVDAANEHGSLRPKATAADARPTAGGAACPTPEPEAVISEQNDLEK
jgi:hypothetical protein